MNGVIRELPQLLRDKIAAGEVVERPASVVKELVENSIDAGATAIIIEIEKGGREYISVADNGSGIQPEYIKTAFLPHATSKLTSDDDLEKILTKGFRGEALASIAAVSELKIVTKVENSEFGLSYSVTGGIGGEVVPAGRDIGTTISVSRLFYNTPARLKFLKKDVAEGNAVVDSVSKIALAHPEIAFTLIRDGNTVLQCRANGDRLVAINALVSKDIHNKLKPLVYSEDGYTIEGFIGTAEIAKSTRSMQYFYVNGRYIKNKSFHAAVDQGISGLFMHGKHPIVFVFLTMPADLVDVNVHPAKIEVRFAEERKVFSAIYRAIKSAFIVPPVTEVPEIIYEKEPETTIQSDNSSQHLSLQNEQENNVAQPIYQQPTSTLMPSYSSQTLASPASTYSYNNTSMPRSTNRSIDIDYNEELSPTPKPIFEQQRIEESKMVDIRLVGEVFSTYIVLEIEDKMVLMDKHAAHERIIYERLIKQRAEEIDSQLLLTPITVDVGGELKTILLDNRSYLEQLGIEIEDFGGGSVRLYSLPADIDGYNVDDLLCELAEGLNVGSMTVDERTKWVYHSIACRAAIKAGDRLSNTELLKLANDIYSGGIPVCCPHGRPVMISYSKKELEGKFGRS